MACHKTRDTNRVLSGIRRKHKAFFVCSRCDISPCTFPLLIRLQKITSKNESITNFHKTWFKERQRSRVLTETQKQVVRTPYRPLLNTTMGFVLNKASQQVLWCSAMAALTLLLFIALSIYECKGATRNRTADIRSLASWQGLALLITVRKRSSRRRPFQWV